MKYSELELRKELSKEKTRSWACLIFGIGAGLSVGAHGLVLVISIALCGFGVWLEGKREGFY